MELFSTNISTKRLGFGYKEGVFMKIRSCLNILRFRLAIFLLEFSIFYLAKSKFNFVLNVILMIEINLSPSKPLRHLKFENDNLNFEKL